MEIQSYNQLNQALIDQIITLEKICQLADGTHKDIYFDSSFNFDQEMPSSFLAFEDNQIVGFLSIYADNQEEAEVSLIVHPDYRQQGIATALLKEAELVKDSYHIDSFVFVTERNFMNNHPFVSEKMVEETDTLELLLHAEPFVGAMNDIDFSDSDITVRLGRAEDIPEIAALQAIAFDETYEISERYARESMESMENLIYVFLKEGVIIGSTAVNLTPNYYYLFSLAVLPGLQDQGVGTAAMAQVMQYLNEIESLPYKLSVEKSNVPARKLYANNGFRELTEVVYLRRR